MRYSLLSRFQGTLLGAALGETLGTYCYAQRNAKEFIANLDQGCWCTASTQAVGWGQIALTYADRLIQSAGGNEPAEALTPTLKLSAGWGIATLPIALFFHEDLEKLRSRLSQTIALGKDDRAVADDVFALGYPIALALQERLHPAHLIPQLLNLERSSQNSLLTAQLRQVQSCIEQQFGISKTMTLLCQDFQKQSFQHRSSSDPDLSSLATAIAFYCFLSTPEDYSLTLLRCARSIVGLPLPIRKAVPIAAALAGALSGAFNSASGIPLDWRRQLQPTDKNSPLVRLWNLESTDKLMQIAAQLAGSWSGVYQPRRHPSDSALAIAAPHVIRPL